MFCNCSKHGTFSTKKIKKVEKGRLCGFRAENSRRQRTSSEQCILHQNTFTSLEQLFCGFYKVFHTVVTEKD